MDTYHNLLQQGEKLIQIGKFKEALAIFDSILQYEPGNSAALNDKGVALSKLGRTDEAIKVLKKAVESHPGNQSAVYNLISKYIDVRLFHDAENVIGKYGNSLPNEDKTELERKIEKGKYVKEIKAGTEPFDFQSYHKQISELSRKTIFFIMGAPKSGTTWLQYILNGHPDIWCSGEANYNILYDYLTQVVNKYNETVFFTNRKIENRDYEIFSVKGLDYLLVIAVLALFNNSQGQKSRCLGSKAPILVNLAGYYGNLFPTAKFIHIIRDGRDVATSGWFANIRSVGEAFKKNFPDFASYVDQVSRIWLENVRNGRNFGKNNPGRYFELRYEDLVKSPKTVIKQILQFLGMDSSPETVDGCINAGSFRRLSKGRNTGEEDKNSFFRKGIIGDWKNHFTQLELNIFLKNSGNLLNELGYEQI